MAPGIGDRRSAGLDSRGKRFYIYPYFQTTAGLSLVGEPVIILEHLVSDAELGAGVTASLAQHRQGVAHPNVEELNKAPHPILAAAGIKSWATFSRNARYCSISEEPGSITITPTRRGAGKSSYLFMAEKEVSLALPASPTEIGAAVREALSRCLLTSGTEGG